MAVNIDELLDDIEKSHRLVTASVDPRARKTGCVSTGLLSLDLFLGGGYIGGAWYTFYGGEQSAKSTSVSTAMAMLAMAGVRGTYWDFEGSSAPDYQANIVARIAELSGKKKEGKTVTIDDVFGVRDPDTGKYLVKPIFRLYTESIGDKLFDSMSQLVKLLPDKVYEKGKWYYIYDTKPADQKIDKQLSSRGSYYVEAENPAPELAIFMDSYSAMYPETLDDGKGQGMAAVARMFSENIPKIAGRLRKKGIVIIGVNQMRLKPAVMFGNPEYEPNGEAVKFISSVRIKNTARAIPHGKGQLEQEASVLLDGDDEYQYICMRPTKNKQYNSTGLESWQRVWKSDPQGTAHGFDPVWNIYDYLLLTGQATRFGSGTKRKIDLYIKDVNGEKVVYEAEDLDWWDFKALILLRGKERVNYAKELGMDSKTYKTFFADGALFNHCRNQILEGSGIRMAFELKNGASSEDEVEEDEDD